MPYLAPGRRPIPEFRQRQHLQMVAIGIVQQLGGAAFARATRRQCLLGVARLSPVAEYIQHTATPAIGSCQHGLREEPALQSLRPFTSRQSRIVQPHYRRLFLLEVSVRLQVVKHRRNIARPVAATADLTGISLQHPLITVLVTVYQQAEHLAARHLLMPFGPRIYVAHHLADALRDLPGVAQWVFLCSCLHCLCSRLSTLAGCP